MFEEAIEYLVHRDRRALHQPHFREEMLANPYPFYHLSWKEMGQLFHDCRAPNPARLGAAPALCCFAHRVEAFMRSVTRVKVVSAQLVGVA
jgi:hypothetical protein